MMSYLPKIRRYDEDTWPGSIEGVDRRREGSFEGLMAEPDEQPDQLASPGGTLYDLKKGTGRYGYEGVFAPHGPEKGFHSKLRLDANSKDQTTLPGPSCKTPAEAALRLAKFRAMPFEIAKRDPRS